MSAPQGWTRKDVCTYTKPVACDVASLEEQAFSRADLIFEGVDHSAESFEARVYFNNPAATVDTGKRPESGYAGSFYVFGHHGCGGDVGHCEFKQRSAYDPRGPHHMRPHTFTVVVSRALQRLRDAGEPLRDVSVVPVIHEGRDKRAPNSERLLQFDRMMLRTYSGGASPLPLSAKGGAETRRPPLARTVDGGASALAAVSGIGPRFAEELAAAGLVSLEALAELDLSSDDLARIPERLRERAKNERWDKQARRLIADKPNK